MEGTKNIRNLWKSKLSNYTKIYYLFQSCYRVIELINTKNQIIWLKLFIYIYSYMKYCIFWSIYAGRIMNGRIMKYEAHINGLDD